MNPYFGYHADQCPVFIQATIPVNMFMNFRKQTGYSLFTGLIVGMPLLLFLQANHFLIAGFPVTVAFCLLECTSCSKFVTHFLMNMWSGRDLTGKLIFLTVAQFTMAMGRKIIHTASQNPSLSKAFFCMNMIFQ